VSTAIKVEGLGKQYNLRAVGTGTLSHDLNRAWHKIRGKEDPYLKIGDTNYRNTKSGSDFVWALRDINFEVSPGEVLGIVGNNGAGKSTLLKILSQITSPTLGEITIHGRIAALLEVGTGFHPELTGRENIFLNGAILGMTKLEIKKKLDEIVDFSGVSRYLDTPVKRYSSGMLVRLGFAVAAHLEPEILIVDEVLAVGDIEFQQKCLGKMKDVSQHGRTILFVSHNMSAVKTLCSKSLLLKDGTLDSIGSTDEIVSRYLNLNSEITQSGIIPDNFIGGLGTGEGKFRMIQVIEGSKNVSQLYFRDSLKIRFRFQANEPLKDVIFAVHLYSADGIQLAYAESSKGYLALENLPEGEHSYEVEIDVIPMPGEFAIGMSAYHSNGINIDTIEKGYDFNVISTSRSNDQHYKWNTAHGYIFSNSKWIKL
jgi:lipopolysaccharide transport system ATP-binding protein